VKTERQRRDWEDLAAEDLYWSILSDPDKRFEDQNPDLFLASGRAEIDTVLERASDFGLPHARGSALDFGCGAGRLTRALAGLFQEAVGIDISARMIDEARSLNRGCTNCTFEVNVEPHLRMFGDASFDAVYSSIVLQHVADEKLIHVYLGELVRVLRPGGLLAFQLPSRIPLRNKLQPRRRVYGALRRLGVPRRVLFRQLRLQPIAMQAVPAESVTRTLERSGAVVLTVDSLTVAGGGVSSTYFATIPSSSRASSPASTARE
jgi:ubiquinone/menaquinone biosynthesis C-methylase UbiE